MTNDSTAPSEPCTVCDIAHSETATILIVDDQALNLQMMAQLLEEAGHKTVRADNANEAIKAMARELPDLVLLDIIMPEVDGIELCGRIRQQADWVDVPIIFVSAADDKDLIVRALQSGGVDYVTKPYNKAELLSRVRTHIMLRAALKRAQKLAEDREELLGILAHDMKNVLGGIKMSAQLLYDAKSSQSETKTLSLSENILLASDRLLRFVGEFLANTSADHGLCVSIMPLDIVTALINATREFSSVASTKQITFHCELPTEKLMVKADTICLEQIFSNLLSNAIKFSPPQTAVRVTMEAKEERVYCSIHDEGPGFTVEDREKLFRRYGRLSAKPTAQEPSSGLGLSIVKKMLDAMEGTIELAKDFPTGAKMTFSLPRSPHL